ncbi:MAG TPA: hypothetical protein VFK81_02130 [Terriglobales bacterium]|nr:hypothetical protein [Terriglobales bacterium]
MFKTILQLLLAAALLTGVALSQTGLAASQPQSQASPAAQPETHITPQQAQELFRSVDQILAFASQDSGLPIRHTVKRALVSRE